MERMLGLFLVLTVAGMIRFRIRRRRRPPGEEDGGFSCRVRALGTTPSCWPRLRTGWPAGWMRAQWVGEVLLVRHGLFLNRYETLSAQPGGAGIRPLPKSEVRRCGRSPIIIELRISDGSRVEVATAGKNRLSLVGPYLTAALAGLPPAPVPRLRKWGRGV